jgi:hypothetical protein
MFGILCLFSAAQRQFKNFLYQKILPTTLKAFNRISLSWTLRKRRTVTQFSKLRNLLNVISCLIFNCSLESIQYLPL